MKTKNGILGGIIAFVLLTAILFGVFYVINSNEKKKNDQAVIITKIDNLKDGDVYTLGDKFGIRLRANSDKELVKVYYVLNGETVELEATAGATSTFESERTIGNKKFSIDSGVCVIDTEKMNTGYFALMAYAEDVDGNVYAFSDTALTFEIVAPVA